MIQTYSDIELINELSNRFESIKRKNLEQITLMEQLKITNDKLIQSEKIKTNFLSNIRNEMNNPITSIMGLSFNLIENKLSETEIKRISKLIYNEMFNLDFQLKNIFLSADIEAGNIIITPTMVNINSILLNTVNSFSDQIRSKKLIIDQKLDIAEGFITDSEYITTIFNNLISNAVRFSTEESVIHINAALKESKLYLSIQNNFNSDQTINKDLIFDRFRQMNEGLTKSYMGHGLGLSIVKSLIDQLDGEIDVRIEKNSIIFHIELNQFHTDEIIEMSSEDGNDFLFINEAEIRL